LLIRRRSTERFLPAPPRRFTEGARPRLDGESRSPCAQTPHGTASAPPGCSAFPVPTNGLIEIKGNHMNSTTRIFTSALFLVAMAASCHAQDEPAKQWVWLAKQ